MTSNTAELDADEEAKLAEFLQKVTQAAKNDPSVPSFVGEQTSSWLQELMGGAQGGAGVNIIDIPAEALGLEPPEDGGSGSGAAGQAQAAAASGSSGEQAAGSGEEQKQE